MTNLIEHHETFDITGFYENIKSGYVGIDYHDFDRFMRNDGEKHSFIGASNGFERVKNAIENIMSSNEALSVINRASAIMITIVHSPESKSPLRVDEISYVNSFIENLPERCDIVWGITEDRAIGEGVKVILLANILLDGA